MAKLFDNSDFSDVVVSCGRLRIKAHKVVLCSHSDTFRTAFHNKEGAVISSTSFFRVHIWQNVWSLDIQQYDVQYRCTFTEHYFFMRDQINRNFLFFKYFSC
jgi:hypothetical protein